MSRPIKQFDECYAPDPNSGCWIFTGCWDSYGYGKMRNNIKAHRYSFEAHKGEVPPGSLVCHNCDTPACVNPEHLFVGTSLDNTKDCRNKGRLPFGESHHRSKLSKLQVLEIVGSTDSHAEIGRRFGVHENTVAAVRCGKTWAHVTGISAK